MMSSVIDADFAKKRDNNSDRILMFSFFRRRVGMSLMLSQFVRLRHVEITAVTEKPVLRDEFEMSLVGVTVERAGPRERGRTVGTLCLLFLVGVNERAVKLDGLGGGKVSTTFRTAVPVILKLVSERRNIHVSIEYEKRSILANECLGV